jgi:hypothetical protein
VSTLQWLANRSILYGVMLSRGMVEVAAFCHFAGFLKKPAHRISSRLAPKKPAHRILSRHGFFI